MYTTNYKGHDDVYKKLKFDESKIGWSELEDYQEFMLTIQPMISPDFGGSSNNFHQFPQSGKLLELGCGAGNISEYFYNKGYDCTGVDISETAINWAKEKYEASNQKIKFFNGDVTNLSFLDNQSFDVIIDGHCLHCIIDDDRNKFFQEAKRLLKDNGRFIINTMVVDFIGDKFKDQYDIKSKNLISTVGNQKIATRHIGTKETILSEIENNGFEALEYYFRKRNCPNSFDDFIVLLAKK